MLHISEVPTKHDTLTQCWASVADGGPTLNGHLVNVSCLLGRIIYITSKKKQKAKFPLFNRHRTHLYL